MFGAFFSSAEVKGARRGSLLGLLSFVAALGVPRGAGAQQGFVGVGPLFSHSLWAKDAALGVGGELSFMAYPDGLLDDLIGVGAFVQAERYAPGSAAGKHERYAAGLQIGSFYGLELGAAYRSETPAYANTAGVHAALFNSVGWASFALRADIAAGGWGAPNHGSELAFVWSIKLPVQAYGDREVLGPMHQKIPVALCLFACD